MILNQENVHQIRKSFAENGKSWQITSHTKTLMDFDSRYESTPSFTPTLVGGWPKGPHRNQSSTACAAFDELLGLFQDIITYKVQVTDTPTT